MKSLFVFALVALLSFGASAQQFTIDPATSNQTLIIEDAIQLPAGDIVTVGLMGQNAHISRQTSVGVLGWSVVWDVSSALYRLTSTNDGNFVAVGSQASSGLAVKFGPGGNIIWSKTFSVTDSVVAFRDVVIDGTGMIRIVGDKSKNPTRREILLQLDQDGNFSCGTQLLSSTILFARRVFILNDHIFVFGEGWRFGKGIGMAKYTLSDNLVAYTVFGGFGPNDNFRDVVRVGNKFIFSYSNDNAPDIIMLVRVNEDLEIEGVPVMIQPGVFDSGGLTLAGLGVGNTNEVYVCGAMAGSGFNASFVLKTDVNLGGFWAKKLLFGGLPTKTIVRKTSSGNGIILANTRNNNTPFANAGATVTQLSVNGDINSGFNYCHSPQAFEFSMVPNAIAVQPQTRIQIGLTLTSDIATFSPYVPREDPCELSMLPVELASFRGEQDGGTAKLYWTTSSELHNSHFRILRSDNSVDWIQIDSVPGVGTSQVPTDYTFTDVDPISGGNYYQLVQVDFDGTETLSDMAFVNFERPLEVYPNPVVSGQTLQVKDGKAFQVLNSQGQVVLESVNGQMTISLPPGLYVARSVEGDASAKVLVN